MARDRRIGIYLASEILVVKSVTLAGLLPLTQ
jgi:hypothetical protein